MRAWLGLAAAACALPGVAAAQERPDQKAFFSLYKGLVETNTVVDQGSCTTAAQQIASLPGVAKTTTGLTLLAEHQEGVVPKIVATLKTQAKTFQIQRNLPRPTAGKGLIPAAHAETVASHATAHEAH